MGAAYSWAWKANWAAGVPRMISQFAFDDPSGTSDAWLTISARCIAAWDRAAQLVGVVLDVAVAAERRG